LRCGGYELLHDDAKLLPRRERGGHRRWVQHRSPGLQGAGATHIGVDGFSPARQHRARHRQSHAKAHAAAGLRREGVRVAHRVARQARFALTHRKGVGLHLAKVQVGVVGAAPGKRHFVGRAGAGVGVAGAAH